MIFFISLLDAFCVILGVYFFRTSSVRGGGGVRYQTFSFSSLGFVQQTTSGIVFFGLVKGRNNNILRYVKNINVDIGRIYTEFRVLSLPAHFKSFTVPP